MRLKLNAARTYVKALQSSLNPISLNTTDSVKLSAKVRIVCALVRAGDIYLLHLTQRPFANSLLTNACIYAPLHFHPQVFGLGPIFQLSLELQNNNSDNFISDLLMVFDYDAKIYRLERNVLQIACLLSTYRCTNRVQCISELNLADTIKVRVRHGSSNVVLYYSLTHFSILFTYFLSSYFTLPFFH